KFTQDLTVPDGTVFAPGAAVDKQWLVTNTGSCSWGPAYRLRLISGEALGLPPEQALYPALAGTQATLRLVFTAPSDPGSHQGAWQAFSPEGIAFGEAVYIQIVVSP
ncbi:MAG TPA: NBR1-Ig-like domain-containing protein, partial [Ramlibacter sp.]|nr:NBR1-Ig-like domain-containing protein [Ramlibacter sp.]